MKNIFSKIWQNYFLIIPFLVLSIFCFVIFSATANAGFAPPIGPEDGLIAPDTTGTESEDVGANVMSNTIMQIVDIITKIAGSVAVLMIVILGMQMVTAGGNEEQANKAKKGATWALVSLGLLLLVEPMINGVLYNGGEVLKDEATMTASIAEGTRQIMAFLEWGKALIITVAFMYLILSGWRMIQALGDQEIMSNQKQVFLWIAIGFLIIAINNVVINEVIYKVWLKADYKVGFAQDPVKGIAEFVGVIKFILKFVGLLAFVAFIWGGGLFLVSFGNDEMIDKGKKIMIDAIIGLIVILISFALISTLMTGQVN